VSCPDWSGVAARREAEPADWAAAVEHFDVCSLCRREALMTDPLLLFRRLPAAELTPAEERSEVEAMRQAVAAMRTARRLEARRRFAGWRRWAAAAVLAVAALSVGRDKASRSEPAATMTPAAAPVSAAAPTPTLEGVNRPGARVYHVDGEGISVFMVYDESLDV
jgi:hypothetical protein